MNAPLPDAGRVDGLQGTLAASPGTGQRAWRGDGAVQSAGGELPAAVLPQASRLSPAQLEAARRVLDQARGSRRHAAPDGASLADAH